MESMSPELEIRCHSHSVKPQDLLVKIHLGQPFHRSDCVGWARYQRPACVLPADPPGLAFVLALCLLSFCTWSPFTMLSTRAPGSYLATSSLLSTRTTAQGDILSETWWSCLLGTGGSTTPSSSPTSWHRRKLWWGERIEPRLEIILFLLIFSTGLVDLTVKTIIALSQQCWVNCRHYLYCRWWQSWRRLARTSLRLSGLPLTRSSRATGPPTASWLTRSTPSLLELLLPCMSTRSSLRG